METATDLLRELLLPRLEKDANFRQYPGTVSGLVFRADGGKDDFWTKFTTDFLDYERDPKPVFAALYSLELEDPERIIKKLPGIHRSLIMELAEQYVLGERSEAIDRLVRSKNAQFLKQVSFFSELRNAAASMERERMIQDMPETYAALSEEIPDDALQAGIKKKGREELRAKFRAWDEELEEKNVIITSDLNQAMVRPPEKPEEKREELPTLETAKPKPGLFSYAWLYAIAAVLLIGFFIWQPTQKSGSELFNSYAGSEEVLSEIDFGELPETEDAVATRGGELRFSGYTQQETQQALEAISLFQEQEFNEAKQLLKELNPRERNEKLLFFLAVSQLNSGETDKAIQELEFLQGRQGYVYGKDVKFHLALGYLEQGNTGSAQELLQELENSAGKYSEQATEILEDMRWF